jgi:hypothetical protein
VSGRITTTDRADKAICKAYMHKPAGDSYGIPCHSSDAREAPYEASLRIPVGGRFYCETIPGLRGEVLDISVTCEGYGKIRSRAFQWEVKGWHCSSVDLGDLVVEPARP